MSAVALRRVPRASAGSDLAPLAALTLGTVLATVWAVIAGGWNEGMSLALLTTAVAVLEAGLISLSAAGRLAAGLAAPCLGVLVIVPLTASGMPAGTGSLRDAAGSYAHALFLGLTGDASWAFIVGFCGGVWLLGFWTGWLVMRERRGMLAVIPCYTVLAVNALNAPSLRGVAVPEALALAGSLLLLGRTHLAELESAWRRGRVIALPGTRSRYVAVTAGAVLGLVLLAVVVPPLSQADLSSRLFRFNLGGGGKGAATGHAVGPGGRLGPGTVSYSPVTEPGGALVNDPRPVLAYTTTSNETVYLRVTVDVRFNAGNWFPADALRRVPVAVDAGNPVGEIPRDREPGHGADTGPRSQVHLRLALAPGSAQLGDGRAIFAGDPERVDRAAAAAGYDASVEYATSSPDLVTVDDVALAGGYGSGNATLQTDASTSTATEAQLRAAAGGYPAWVSDAGYLDLGPDPAAAQLAEIKTLAQQWSAGATTPYDVARALESHLRSTEFKYTLTPPQAPAGEWPLRFFLLRSHQGYCQYYASAMGIMLRLLGVPARLVSGYGPGTPDDANASARSTTFRVTTSDAHVWVEAYFPGDGWVTFEPTPATQYGFYQPVPRPGAAATVSPTQPSASATPTPRPTPTPSPTPAPAPPAGGGSTGQSVPPALLGGGLGAVTIAVVLGLAFSWLLRPRDTAALWLRLRLVGRLLGVRHRRTETQAAFLRRVSAALPPDGASVLHPHGSAVVTGRRLRGRSVEALALLSSLVGKAAFSRDGLTAQEQVRWRRAWGRLCRALPVLCWRRLLGTAPSARLGAR